MESKKTGNSALIGRQVGEVEHEAGVAKSAGSTKGGADQASFYSQLTERSLQTVNDKPGREEMAKPADPATVGTKKDNWDKLAAVSPIISGFLIFITGFYCSYSFNQQQIRIQQCQTIEKFIPHLMGNEQSKKAAILALSSLINTETASKFAAIFASTGTVSALQSLSQSGSDKDKLIATQALSTALESLAERESQLSNIETDYKKALLDKDHKAGTADDPDTPYKLAQIYIVRGQYAQAEPLLKKALEIRERVYGPEHQQVADTLKSLAELYQLSGQANLAEAALKRARSIEQKGAGKPGNDTSQTLPAEGTASTQRQEPEPTVKPEAESTEGSNSTALSVPKN